MCQDTVQVQATRVQQQMCNCYRLSRSLTADLKWITEIAFALFMKCVDDDDEAFCCLGSELVTV